MGFYSIVLTAMKVPGKNRTLITARVRMAKLSFLAVLAVVVDIVVILKLFLLSR